MKLLVLSILLIFPVCTSLAQNTMIPYRYGSLWGASDTLGNMILAPVYDSIIPNETYGYKKLFPDDYFLVYKNGRYGVAYKGKVIIPPELVSVSFNTYDRLIIEDLLPHLHSVWRNMYTSYPLTLNTRKRIFNYNGELVVKDTILRYESLYMGQTYRNHQLHEKYALISFMYASGKYGLALYNNESQSVNRWLFQNVPVLETEQPDLDHIYINIVRNSTEYMSMTSSFSYGHFQFAPGADGVLRLGAVKAKGPKDTITGYYRLDYDTLIHDFTLKTLTLQERDSIFPLRFVDNLYNQWYCHNQDPWTYNLTIGIQGYFYTLHQDTIFYLLGKPNKSYSLNQFYSSIYDTLEVFTMLDTFGIVQYSAVTDKELNNSSNLNYVLYRRDGLYGIINHASTIKPLFYSITKGYLSKHDPVFIVEYKLKTGLIDGFGNFVLNPWFDSMTHVPTEKGLFFKSYINESVGLANAKDGILLPCQYDSIYLLEETNSVFITMKNNLYGYYSYYKPELNTEPVFEYEPKSVIIIDGKIFYKLYNDEGRLMGYVDSNGNRFYINL